MYKYLLGFIAGMSIVPFAYFANTIQEGDINIYGAVLIIPILIIALTAITASKLDRKAN